MGAMVPRCGQCNVRDQTEPRTSGERATDLIPKPPLEYEQALWLNLKFTIVLDFLTKLRTESRTLHLLGPQFDSQYPISSSETLTTRSRGSGALLWPLQVHIPPCCWINIPKSKKLIVQLSLLSTDIIKHSKPLSAFSG
ncbi:hypothetical protein STEG23_009302 [Scotinomys teguina]